MRSASYKMAEEPEYAKRETFTSYVVPGETLNITSEEIINENEWCLPKDKRDVLHCEPRLISNEQIVASAPAYLCSAFAPIDMDAAAMASTTSMTASTPASYTGSSGSSSNSRDRGKSVLGLLTVTNFKLSFVPLPEQRHALAALDLYQENLFLQRNDVTLNNIDHIYRVSASGSRAANALSGVAGGVGVGSGKRKKIDSQQKKMQHGRIAALHVVCKNFRLLKFAFQQSTSSRDHGNHILSALSRFVFISNPELTFTLYYKEPYIATPSFKTTLAMYTTQNDWAREIIRCGATGRWRVYTAKAQADVALPPHCVIPQCLRDDDFVKYSRAFYDGRAPIWVYEFGGVASLVRVAELRPDTQHNTTVENVALETVRKLNEKLKLHRMQLTDCLPSIQDVQRAYQKFQRLCTPEDSQQFLAQDTKYLTLLEKSNWLFYVSLCLRYASEAAEKLRAGTSCVLQESRGRDLCCVVSSLTQIILDPLYRTMVGFQSLVQKEWVALEHPFRTRLGHAGAATAESGSGSGNGSGGGASASADDAESPIFLLFLDCVWQLLQQYPDEFEYSQTYLTTVWDSCFMPIFDTFQFDSNAERQAAVEKGNLIQRPVWDWSEQFAEKDQVFFTNPFYQRHRGDSDAQMRRSVALPANISNHHFANLNPQYGHGMQQQRYSQQITTNISRQQQQQQMLFATKSTIPTNRYLQPAHQMSQLQVWEQCYYRWMPVLEIMNGGYAQIDLHQRILLSNIAKLQRANELQDFSDLPDIYYQLTGEERASPLSTLKTPKATNSSSNSSGSDAEVEHRCKTPPLRTTTTAQTSMKFESALQIPNLSSFFPFSGNAGETQQLSDILTNSNEFLLEGSIMDRLSIA